MGQNPIPKLSRRQQQCLEGVAARLDSQQIGDRLGISPHTVDGHIAAAVAALGASSRRDAVRIWQSSSCTDAGEKFTGDFLPVDFPPCPADWGHGSVVREAPAPAVFRESMAHIDRREGYDERPRSALKAVAITAGLAAALAILLLAVPQLGQNAQALANLIQPYHQH